LPGLKGHVQATLVRLGLYHRLKASRVYDWYWRIADRRVLDDRGMELAFYRSIIANFRPGDLIYDVGANHGAKSDLFLRLGATVVAVEPDRANGAILEQKFRKFRLKRKPLVVVNKALSDRRGREVMWVDEPGSAKNTLNRKWVDILRTDTSRFGHKLNFAQQQEVETVTFDDLETLYGVPVFVKIDVEGSEPSVLRGMKRPVSLMSFEVNLPDFLTEGRECVSLLERLDPHGRFNYTADCRHGLALERWLMADAFARLLATCKETSIEVFWKASTEMHARQRVSA
jgi:FkbM family methyltransferase